MDCCAGLCGGDAGRSLLPFLIDSGLRISDACALTWDTVSLEPKEGAERGWVYVIKGKSKYAKRYVPLTGRAHAVLAECRKKSKGPFVFTAFDGRRRMSRHWPAEQFKAMRDKLGLPWDCVLHSTRRTFCTRLGERGCDAFTIQKLAGHSSMISQRYAHPTPERLESAIGQQNHLQAPRPKTEVIENTSAKVAELADAPDLGSGG